ncbi:MAG: hypothetical protein M1837_003257 [Sclerophora amabilis]|nr:MAG: hypothetical protein M1837_003257 [Sclerophora amabilis]
MKDSDGYHGKPSPNLSESYLLETVPGDVEAFHNRSRPGHAIGNATESRARKSLFRGDTGNTQSQRRRWGGMSDSMTGWRCSVMIAIVATSAVLLINIVWTVWAVLTYGSHGGYTTLYEGNCSKTSKLSTWLHLVINVLSSVLLGGSNFCMQTLMAPTRREVDRAHARGKWLDIGVPSVRNLTMIHPRRAILWCFLVLSSLPLHLLYNSAVFSSTTAREFAVAITSEEVLNDIDDVHFNSTFFGQDPIWGGITSNNRWSGSEEQDILPYLLENHSKFEQLDNAECVQSYNTQYNLGRRHAILVSDFGEGNRTMFALAQYGPERGVGDPEANWALYYPVAPFETGLEDAANWQVRGHTIQRCLSEKFQEDCRLQFSPIIMIVVITCNLIKVLSLGLSLYWRGDSNLATLGDAISSFLDSPDDATTQQCWLSREAVLKGHWNSAKTTAGPESQLKIPPWHNKRRRWREAASKIRWATCYVPSLAVLIVAAVLLGDQGMRLNSELSIQGFGSNGPKSIVKFANTWDIGIIGAILVSNIPHLVLSCLYFSYNGLMSCMLMTREWVGYSCERRPLRVTSPSGQQRSTYWLAMPYKYGIPFITASSLLHWLISQSIYLVLINWVDFGGADVPDWRISSCGFSNLAIILTLAFGSTLLIVGIGLGFRRYQSGMPLASSCSAAISAACHPPSGDVDAARKPVKWGAIEHNGPSAHCTFTSKEVNFPFPGQHHARLLS